MDAKAARALGAALVVAMLALSGCATTAKPGAEPAAGGETPATAEDGASQGATADPAADPAAEPAPALPPAPPASAVLAATESYRIGVDDEVEISVYGYDGLNVRQVVRPDGRLDVPVVGEVNALGMTPAELRSHLAAELGRSFASPRVNVVVRGFGSRRVNVIGQVRRPGSVTLGADKSLLRTLALAGGLTDRADLRGARIVREGVAQPVRLDLLLQQGDLAQNVEMQPNDTLIVPNSFERRAVVLGEVKAPQVVPLHGDVTVMEAVVRSQGFTRSAAEGRLVLVRGGMKNGKVFELDADAVMKDGDVTQNLLLEHGDIVYVPKTVWATVVDIFVDISRILQPAVLAETGIILGPDMVDVLKGQSGDTNTGIVVSP